MGKLKKKLVSQNLYNYNLLRKKNFFFIICCLIIKFNINFHYLLLWTLLCHLPPCWLSQSLCTNTKSNVIRNWIIIDYCETQQLCAAGTKTSYCVNLSSNNFLNTLAAVGSWSTNKFKCINKTDLARPISLTIQGERNWFSPYAKFFSAF